MARSSSLAARVRALEEVSGTGQDITVLIRHFGRDAAAPAHRLVEGDAAVERQDFEDVDAFRARAVAVLRRGRRGLVVLAEKNGED